VRPNPFADARVRRALSLGLDRSRFSAALDALPASQPVPMAVFGFNPRLPDIVTDKDASRALLRQAGFPTGFGVVLHAREPHGQAARIVAEELQTLGIRAELRVLPAGQFFRLVNAGEATLWLNSFSCQTGDAAEYLEQVAHSPDPQRFLGMVNQGGYADPELDAAIERSATIEVPEDRRAALEALIARVVAEQVVTPLYVEQDVYLVSRSLVWDPRPDGNLLLQEMSTSSPPRR
jgi:peptide/nickel transport system substrate-binding protein